MLSKRRDLSVILILLCSFLMACGSGEVYRVSNGEVQVGKSLRFALGDQGKTVLEAFGSDFESLSYPGGEDYFFKKQGFRFTIRDDNGRIDFVSFLFTFHQTDNSPGTNTLIDLMDVEGMEFRRIIDFNHAKEILEKNGYQYEEEEWGKALLLNTDLANGYLCSFFFEKDNDLLLNSIQYYRKK